MTLTAAGQGVVAASKAGFYTLNSTCASSALVAGIAGLIRSEFPNLTVTQVRESMTRSTVYHPRGGMHDGSGYGTVDAIRALTSASTMSPPRARPAMLGARPRNRPVPPPVRSSTSLIMHKLAGDAVISGAILAVLLISIGLYGNIARRRERQEAALAVVQSSERASARSGHGTMLADPLLEFFGPQHARPASQSAAARPPTPRFQPRPDLTGRSTMSAALGVRSAATQVGHAQVGPVQVGPVQVGPAQVGPAQVGPAQVGPAQVGPGQVNGQVSAAGQADRPALAGRLPVRLPARRGAGSDSTVRRTEVTGTPPWRPGHGAHV